MSVSASFISLPCPLPSSLHLLSVCLTLWATLPMWLLSHTLHSVQASQPLTALSVIQLVFTQSCILLTWRVKSGGAHAMLFIRTLHKGWLGVFWSVAGPLWRSHTVRQPVLLTFVWWSKFPQRPEHLMNPTQVLTLRLLCHIVCLFSGPIGTTKPGEHWLQRSCLLWQLLFLWAGCYRTSAFVAHYKPKTSVNMAVTRETVMHWKVVERGSFGHKSPN